MIKNSIKHLWVGLAVGFFGGSLVNLLPWMDKTLGEPIPYAVKLTALVGAILWFIGTIAFEAWQWYGAGMDRVQYKKYLMQDTIRDIAVGNAAFLLPWLVLTLVTYAGNVLR